MEFLVPWLSAFAGALSGLVLWSFLGGRWTQRQESDFQALERRTSKIESAIRDEDLGRRAFVERVNADTGRIEVRLSLIERESVIRFEHVQATNVAITERLGRIEALLQDMQQRRRTDR